MFWRMERGDALTKTWKPTAPRSVGVVPFVKYVEL